MTATNSGESPKKDNDELIRPILGTINSLPGKERTNENDFVSIDGSLLGKTIGKRFRILSRLGKGGMSEVFKAEHLVLQKIVAIKVLHPHQLMKANSIDRFQQEAKAVSALDHPNIVKVYAFGMAEGDRIYLAMDFLDGPSLSDILESEGALPWRRVVALALQISDGLLHSHSRGVIHRDLKPSNIIVQTNDEGREIPKIVDFGIARLTEDAGKENKQLTVEGSTCGSPPYMSPEQCLGQVADCRSDIYSFGCMLYELLSGSRPFAGNSPQDVMNKQVRQMPKLFRSVCPGTLIPESLEAIVRKCLAKDLNLRYQNMSELNADLKLIGSNSLGEANLTQAFKLERDAKAANFRAKYVLASILSLVGITLVVAGGVFVYSQFFPEAKIAQINQRVSLIPLNDPQRIPKLMVLVPQLIELDLKIGNRDSALLRLHDLEKEVSALPVSMRRAQNQVKLSRYYAKIGKPAEAEVLVNKTIAQLEEYIKICHQQQNLKELEMASIFLQRMCKDDPAKQDVLLGQKSLLASIYVYQNRLTEAESIARSALNFISTNPRVSVLTKISANENLGNILMREGKFRESEHVLFDGWTIGKEKFGPNNEISKHVAKALIQCYRAQGKLSDAENLERTFRSQ